MVGTSRPPFVARTLRFSARRVVDIRPYGKTASQSCRCRARAREKLAKAAYDSRVDISRGLRAAGERNGMDASPEAVDDGRRSSADLGEMKAPFMEDLMQKGVCNMIENTPRIWKQIAAGFE